MGRWDYISVLCDGVILILSVINLNWVLLPIFSQWREWITVVTAYNELIQRSSIYKEQSHYI